MQRYKVQSGVQAAQDQTVGMQIMRSDAMKGNRKRKAANGVSKSSLRLLSNQMKTVFWTTDIRLRVSSFFGKGMPGNPCRAAALVGHTVAELFQIQDPEATPIDAHRRALAGESVTFDMSWMNRAYKIFVEPWWANASRIDGSFGIAFNVTGTRRGPRARCRDAFPVGTTPDIRMFPKSLRDFDDVVVTIREHVHLILQRIAPDDPSREDLQAIQREIDRAAAALRHD
jgi:hypothetical protein